MAKLKNISISQLLVNPKNPRFEHVKNQKKAIEMMLKEKYQDIQNLAKDIAENGFDPSNIPIVVKNDNKFLMLEGNRRLVSVILLNDPTKIKDKKQRDFFKKLRDEYTNQIPTHMQCLVFEKEEDAKHWILIKHTGQNSGKGVVKWNAEQKDRFLGSESKKIQLFDFASENDVSTEDVNITTVDRLISSPYIRKKIGISFESKKLTLKKSKKEIINNLKKVFANMAKSGFTVRDIDNRSDAKKWIDNIIKDPDDSILKSEESSTATKKPKSKKSASRKHLIHMDCNLIIPQKRINDIYLELQDNLVLSGPNATPNAVAVLFRVFLELSIQFYIDNKKISMGSRSILKTRIEKTTEYMCNNNVATEKELSQIRKMTKASKTDILNIEQLNYFIHDSFVYPESDGLKAKWNNLQRFFELLWGDIS